MSYRRLKVRKNIDTTLSLAFPNGLVLRGIVGDNLPIVYQLLSRLT